MKSQGFASKAKFQNSANDKPGLANNFYLLMDIKSSYDRLGHVLSHCALGREAQWRKRFYSDNTLHWTRENTSLLLAKTAEYCIVIGPHGWLDILTVTINFDPQNCQQTARHLLVMRTIQRNHQGVV